MTRVDTDFGVCNGPIAGRMDKPFAGTGAEPDQAAARQRRQHTLRDECDGPLRPRVGFTNEEDVL